MSLRILYNPSRLEPYTALSNIKDTPSPSGAGSIVDILDNGGRMGLGIQTHNAMRVPISGNFARNRDSRGSAEKLNFGRPKFSFDGNSMEYVTINYKGTTYEIPIEVEPWLNKKKSKITLYNDQINLGYLEFNRDVLNPREILYIDSLHNIHPDYAVPTGTILFETVVQIAKWNGLKMIKLMSLDDATNFYVKKGMRMNNEEKYMILNLTKGGSMRLKKHRKTRRKIKNKKTLNRNGTT